MKSEFISRFVSFNTYIQLIKGSPEVLIPHEKKRLKPGDGFAIPPNTEYSIRAKEEVKMITTIFDSGAGEIYKNSFN
jgi:quercetin dioxygenase-like cupin family protein